MIKRYLLGSLLLANLLIQTVYAETPIISAKRFEFESSILNETRAYSVYLPFGYELEENKDKTYPVIYLLDGDASRLKSFGGLVEGLSSWTLSQQIEPALIVALPNVDRVRDFTPTETDFIFKGRTLDTFKATGGADQFARFIEEEVFPKIGKNYRINDSRTLVGQSFGGLFAGHVLATRSDMFDQYLIIDATYLWHDNYLNRTVLSSENAETKRSGKVFFALANNDHLGEIGITNQAWGREFINRMRLNNPDELSVSFKYFADEKHATVELMGWYHGLKYLFAKSKDDS